MRFFARELTPGDAQDISGWRYAAPYDVYGETTEALLNGQYRALCDADGALCGFFCWGEAARVGVAADVYAARPDALDFGLGLRPEMTGKGIGGFAAESALAWLRDAFHPAMFRLAVYEWNARARKVYRRLGFAPETKRGDFLVMLRDERRWRDATRPLENGMRVCATDPAFERHLLYCAENMGWNVSVLAMSAHCGTHLDAPAHVGLPACAETIPVDRLSGMAQLLDWAEPDFAALRAPRVLLKNFGKGFTLAEAEWLIGAGIAVIGVDALSVGSGETEWAVHKLLLESGVTILENAALEGFAPGWYEMRCLPLSLPGSDGVPVRLFLREEIP